MTPLPLAKQPTGPRPLGVVVAAYNAEKWIAQTLESLQVQDYQDWYCVIVDDGSRDATADIVKTFMAKDSRYRMIQQANAGLPAARNSGIAALDLGTDYVAFLDSDDLYQPDALSLLVTALECRPDAVGAYGLAEYVDELGHVSWPGLHPSRQQARRAIGTGWRLMAIPVDADATFATLVVSGPIWPPAVALQRLSAVQDIGGFDVSFTSQEDWDLYVRLTRKGPYVAVNRVVVGYRRHGGNMTNSHYVSVGQQQRVRYNAYHSADNTPGQKHQISRAWRYLEVRQAAVLGKYVVTSLKLRRWHEAAIGAVGSVLCACISLLRGPPTFNPNMTRYMRPAEHPGSTLLPQ
jgi:glycosyltransferase involved in cell wall biosynthesis